jgi:hypothetical protein
MLNALETALGEVYANGSLGSQIVPFPESPAVDMETLSRRFRGQHGRVLLRESVNVTAAGGPGPVTDWKPQDVSPDLSKTDAGNNLVLARAAILTAFGILPAMFHEQRATGPLVREAQRDLAQWTLSPIAKLIAEECSDKLGTEISIDCVRPLRAYDESGRARSLATTLEALAAAKTAGLSPGDLQTALQLVHFEEEG